MWMAPSTGDHELHDSGCPLLFYDGAFILNQVLPWKKNLSIFCDMRHVSYWFECCQKFIHMLSFAKQQNNLSKASVLEKKKKKLNKTPPVFQCYFAETLQQNLKTQRLSFTRFSSSLLKPDKMNIELSKDCI